MEPSKIEKPARLPHPVRLTEQIWPEGAVPVVSVFNWAYDNVEFIRESIESILMQETTFPVEIIIHDDASTDGTTEIIRKYEAKYPQLFRNIIQTENQWSQGKSVMKPIVSAPRGVFIALLHGDDFWTDPLKLQKQVDFLEAHPSCVGCFTAYTCIDSKNSNLAVDQSARFKRKYYNHLAALSSITPKTLTSVFRKIPTDIASDFLSYGRAPNGDLMLWSFLTLRGRVAYLNYPTAAYRVHAASVWSSASGIKQTQWQLKTCRAMFSYFQSPDERLAIRHRLFVHHKKLLKASFKEGPTALWTSAIWVLKDILRYGLPLTTKDRKRLSALKHADVNPEWGKQRSSCVPIVQRLSPFTRVTITAQLLWKHRRSHLFDWSWYRQRNPEVAARTGRLFLHFCLFGVFQGRTPNSRYKASDYSHVEGVAMGRVSPLIYYTTKGYKAEEGDLLIAQRACAAYPGDRAGILYFPQAPSNPYQTLLYRTLRSCYGLSCYGFRANDFSSRTLRLLKGKADTIHLHWIESLCDSGKWLQARKFLAIIKRAKQMGYRILWTIHNEIGHDSDSPAEQRKLRAQLSQLCDHIFVHGLSSLPAYLDGQAEKISLTRHGHYANYYPDFLSSAGARRLLGIPKTSRVALIFGKIRPYKNTVRVLTELAAACESSADGLILVAGSDEMDLFAQLPEPLREHPALRFERRHIPDHEVQFYLRATDVVLIPADKILTSGVAVLAASFNKPVIAMRRGLLPEMLEGVAARFTDTEDEFLQNAKDFFAGRLQLSPARFDQWQDWRSQNSWYHIVRAEPFVSLFRHAARLELT